MRDAFGMRGLERLGDLDPEPDQFFDGYGPLSDPVLERRAVEILHDHARATVLLGDVMNGADVRMVQRGRRTRLSLEPAERVRIPGDGLGEKLERDEPVQADILGLVHDAHPASAYLPDDAVVGDGLTGERHAAL